MKETIKKFEKGTSFLSIDKVVSKEDLNFVHKEYSLENLDIVKFIPASGAATRMFQNLYEYLEIGKDSDFMDTFFNDIMLFPFYEELKLEGMTKKEQVKTVLNHYGDKPKALIKIHKYENTVTPIDEHIYEALQYLNNEDLHLHFTISKNHEKWFNEYVKDLKNDVKITYSFQNPDTDTLAVDLDNKPFVLENGETLYRAGGHGALIHNLNELDADIIMIKNIDNVCHRNMIKDTIDSRKELLNIGLEVQENIFKYCNDLENDNYNMDEIKDFVKNTLLISSDTYDKEFLQRILNRPLRVCGVVKNEGEPGGGPFIIKGESFSSPQIVEMKELDTTKDKEVIDSASYFNPVDVVCFVKDKDKQKYDLLNYIDESRYFISQKSYKGRTLKALEHPGLWNGAMHDWNTVFVNVPLTTFNPIKTVNDLLRKGHFGK